MAISNLRKKLQAKLRRKYRWSTNTDYNRGIGLIKGNAATHLMCKKQKDRFVTDIAIYMNDRDIREGGNAVTMYVTDFRPKDDGTYEKIQMKPFYFQFEELELVYDILKEHMREVKEEK